MSVYIIGEGMASKIAEEFVQQHHSIIKIEKPVLKDEIWHVAVSAYPPNKTFQVKINAKTGYIMGF